MEDLNNIIAGAAKFNAQASHEVKPLLERLAREGQAPDALFITCADSRIDPVNITQTKPGDLFILRNIGNLIPKANSEDSSVMATVEYSTGALGVKTIVICGHSDCGAMKVVLADKDLSTMPNAKNWLMHADPSTQGYKNGQDDVVFAPGLPEVDKLSQINVITQFENLLTYPSVREGIESGNLRLVGMWFDIGNAQLSMYNADTKRFTPIADDGAGNRQENMPRD
ncbi:MAG: carbonic anhydrase [Armatimonadetes bacterium]|nr:carbonic anhydrase [Armatimonadota bacterium]